MIRRLNENAKTKVEVAQYYKTRTLQMNSMNMKSLCGFDDHRENWATPSPSGLVQWSGNLEPIAGGGGYKTSFKMYDSIDGMGEGKEYDSFYITRRNEGHGKEALSKCSNPILTIDDCNITDFLTKHSYPFELLYNEQPNCGLYDAYDLISKHYGDDRANRSGVYLMNHIDEGKVIYKLIREDYANIQSFLISEVIPESYEDFISSEKAYTIHPILQGDDVLVNHRHNLYGTRMSIWSSIVEAMEYRNIANQYLSKRKINNISEINLSPLRTVNLAILVDKIQNYKDFLVHHSGTHERADELDAYFKNWLKRFGVPLEVFNKYYKVLRRIHEPF